MFFFQFVFSVTVLTFLFSYVRCLLCSFYINVFVSCFPLTYSLLCSLMMFASAFFMVCLIFAFPIWDANSFIPIQVLFVYFPLERLLFHSRQEAGIRTLISGNKRSHHIFLFLCTFVSDEKRETLPLIIALHTPFFILYSSGKTQTRGCTDTHLTLPSLWCYKEKVSKNIPFVWLFLEAAAVEKVTRRWPQMLRCALWRPQVCRRATPPPAKRSMDR